MVHGSRFSQIVTGSTLLKTYVCNVVHSKLFKKDTKNIPLLTKRDNRKRMDACFYETEKDRKKLTRNPNLYGIQEKSKGNSTPFTKMCHNVSVIYATSFTSIILYLQVYVSF